MIGVKDNVQIILSVLLTLAIVGAMTAFGWHYKNLVAQAASNAERGQKIIATDGIIKDGRKTDEARERQDQAVAEAASKYEEGLEDEKRNDPAVADRDARLIPDRLRQLARERRLARERSVGTEQRNTKSVAEKDAGER